MYTRTATYSPDVVFFFESKEKNVSASKNAKDCSTGGMLMPGRVFNSTSYTYGYQGQLKTDEVYGSGNLYSFEFREQDPRLIRFWSPDPLESSYPGWSPYAFSQNRLIDAIEFEGLEAHVLNQDDKGSFSLTYDWNAKPLENPTEQVYFNGQAANVSDLSKQYNIQLFDPIAFPKEKLGSEDYYKFRYEDVSIRTGLTRDAEKIPDYYMEYGDVNIRLFKGEAYSKVSGAGKSFIDKAAVGLQAVIEDKLARKGGKTFELSQNFRGFAFGSHPEVYKNAGFLGLDFLDKTYVGLTPPLRHITSEEGMQQVRTMMTLQMKYYKDNPDVLGIHLMKYQYQKYEIQRAIFEKGIKEVSR